MLIAQLPYAQTGYYILRDHKLPLSFVRPVKQELKEELPRFLQSIHQSDQAVRRLSFDEFKIRSRSVDSLNFVKYRAFFEKNGYVSFDKKKLETEAKNVDELLLLNYVYHLHFSDRFGIPLIHLITQSIPKQTCNEYDLMNYFVTYLWRKTEFLHWRYLGIPFHTILMPDLSDGKYADYYKYAYEKYIEYCGKRDPSFLYFYLSGINIKNGIINWNAYQINDYWPGISTKIIDNAVLMLKDIAPFIIKNANAYPIPDGKYSILFCTHPQFNGNPLYLY